MTTGEILAEQMDETRLWTNRLLADVAGNDWTWQPAPGLAHALWLAGHLAVSQHVLVHVRCLGRGILDDAFCAHFAIGGPVPSAREHAYPDVAEVRRVMDDVHATTLAEVRRMSDALLNEPATGKDGAPHPHYHDKRGAVTHAFRHEAFHAGQLALIRRLLGKSFLR
ncbi:MAG: hypothetical protein CHACPFDD_00341 [Phycisphaerae bacterium]|nr:hypothetical protein [Phycisphaerae bacterium]